MPASGNPPTLYLVATPIGNLEDLSPRAARILREVDVVAAEDTRRTMKLLAHLGLSKPLESFHGDSGPLKVERILRLLRDGKSVALVSDAGVPTISDPGSDLVSAAAVEGFRIVPIPGPSAVATALSVSGLNADRFVFAGYPPRRSSERREFLAALAGETRTVVLYEAPHRIAACLQDMVAAVGPQRRLVIGRELTKLHEDILRGTVAELAEHFAVTAPLGEFVLVLEGAPEADEASAVSGTDVVAAVAKLAHGGMSARDGAEVLALLTGMRRNQAYEMILAARREATSEGQ